MTQDSRTLVRRSLDAIEAGNGKLHAFVEIFAETAMARAEALDKRASLSGPIGPLHGMPIAVKDLADIDGRSAGFGSKCYPKKPNAPTAPAIQRLIDAGAVIVGMTHMVEFALGGWGTNHAKGTPWNPADRKTHRVPGGSSSGSAVAVAAGMVPVAIGSDTGGSLRIPGSLCGVVGFKPSYGLIPLDGIAPLAPTFDTLGPIARNIADARLVFQVMAGISTGESKPAGPLRVGVPAPEQLDPCDPEVFANFRRSLEAIRAKGHDVTAMTFPAALTEYQALSGGIVAYEAYRHHKATVEDPAAPLDPHVRNRVRAGRNIDDARYAELQTLRAQAISRFKAEFGHFDVFVLPSTPLPAIEVDAVDEATFTMSRYTRAANWLGLCGISVPNGVTASGLPTGLQAMSWSGADATLLGFCEHGIGGVRQ